MLPKIQSLISTVALIGLVGGTLVGTSKEAWAGDAHFQAKNMIALPAGTPVAGAATLTRTHKDINFRIYTSGLAPGAYTVWIVIFNKPENCTGPCNGPDLGNPAVEGSIVYGTGNMVGPDGLGNFYGSLKEGSPPAGIQMNVPAGLADGLKNSEKAEIHLVVRTHGAVRSDGTAVTQLTTFESSCAPGVCSEPQAVVFEAVE